MSDATEPEITIAENTITVTLPSGDQTVIPTIPEELRGHDVPSFVVEWIMEADEVATIIQELLQAPTRSLCRAMALPTNTAGIKVPRFEVGGAGFKSPTPPVIRRGDMSVTGFAVDGPTIVQGLPEGIRVPIAIMDIVAMARKVDAWMWKGMRVTEWALENGAADASWLPAAD